VKFEPRPYQVTMMQHIFDVPRNACWAGMGLGKTGSVLTALSLQEDFGPRGKTLVLAPVRVAQSVWPDEVAKWDHLKNLEVSVMVGDRQQRQRALQADANVYTMNYENLQWLVQALDGKPWPFQTVVADEATRLKSFRIGGKKTKKDGSPRASAGGSMRARFLARFAHRGPKQWINLTGTPSPNGLGDLWGQTWFLDAGARLGRTYGGFQQRWFQASFDGYGMSPLPFAEEQIHDKLKDICLSFEPPVSEEPILNNIYVDLPPFAMKRYKEMEKEMFTILGGEEIEAFNAASRTNKCLQMANGAVYLNPDDADENRKAKEWKEVHTAKLDALESVINEAAGMPVLVAYNFVSDLERILKAFPKARYLDKKPQTIHDWNAGRIPILVAHPASAGHGLNLQDGGNIIVMFGHDWNLEHYQQIIERIGPVRQAQAGHPRSVFVHHIIARGTVDEMVMARREGKRSVQDLLMEAMRRAA
jgi:SNF2 family DNA or RNA helicase